MKRKLDDFKEDSEFRFWGIVISRFVYNHSRAEVGETFSCSETYVTKVMHKFEKDGGYHDNRQYNRGEHLKTKESVKKVVVKAIKNNLTSPHLKFRIRLLSKAMRSLRELSGRSGWS